MGYYPREVVLREKPVDGEKLVEVLVVRKVGSGGLADIASAISDEGIIIKSGFHRFDDDKLQWTIFLDFSKAKITPEELEKKMSQMKDVSGVQMKSPTLGFESFHFPLNALGYRTILWNAQNLGSYIKRLIEVLGDVASPVLYNLGRAEAEYMWKRMSKEDSSKEDVLKLLQETYRTSGWGIIKFDEINHKESRAKVKIEQHVVPESLGKSDRPVCHDIRGYLAGIFSLYFGRRISAAEVKCMATGDEYCEFEIG